MGSDINGAARHTPGDWYATVREGASMVMVRNPDGSERIIAMDLFDEAADPEIEEVEANAALIAAAPDLLYACEQVLIASEDNGDMDDIDWNQLRAAIAKARQGGGA